MEFVARGIEKYQLLVIPGNVFSRATRISAFPMRRLMR